MEKKVIFLALFIVMLLILPVVSHALTEKQGALVGLKGVGVFVEKLQPEVERLGLSREQIKTDVELKLRKARVMVLTEKELRATPGIPTLYVRITAYITSGIAICIFSSRVELIELVKNVRGFEVSGSVWDAAGVGTLGTDQNIRYLREGLGEMVDRFINDYLAANQK